MLYWQSAPKMQDSNPTPSNPDAPTPLGKIDLHSHLLPGVDDGCVDLEHTLQCIATLQSHGYVGSVCTPHIMPAEYPDNNPRLVAEGVAVLRDQLQQRGIDYQLWPGGELRLWPEAVDWMTANGVPTLGESRCVLMDMWHHDWHECIDRICDWLLEQGYLPILAHPERTAKSLDLTSHFFKKLDALTARGVLLQGNLWTIVGGNGNMPATLFRELLKRNRYAVLASDMHQPDTAADRLRGLEIVAQEFGQDVLEQLVFDAPHRLLLSESKPSAITSR